MSRCPWSAAQPRKLANRVMRLPRRPHRPAMMMSLCVSAHSPGFGEREDWGRGFSRLEDTAREWITKVRWFVKVNGGIASQLHWYEATILSFLHEGSGRG